MLYTIIDIETTGNGLKGNKITEIAIFKFDGSKVIDEFTSLVNPECPIPHFITGLTGIDDETVRNAPTFSEIAQNVLDITEDCVFVAHAVNFDYGVIKEEFRKIGFAFSRKKLCTVRLSRKLLPGLSSYSLGKLCSSINIPITDRHRARGDAEATVTLFKTLLQKPLAEETITTFLNTRSQEATLPPLLDRKVVEALPQKPGVYYFLDTKKNIIYIGKAKNLKKRVLGHFYDKSEHEIKLCREVAHIDVELSGSELIALLMESAAIKKHYPKFNRAQKRTTRRYAIFSYEDRMGFLHLGFSNAKQIGQPLVTLNNPTACRSLLKTISEDFVICPRYCQLIPLTSSSTKCNSPNCLKNCSIDTNRDQHNAKVRAAIERISPEEHQIVLKQPGRHMKEDAFILVENGIYKGYGFIELEETISNNHDLKAHLIPQKNTVETERIIENALMKLRTRV